MIKIIALLVATLMVAMMAIGAVFAQTVTYSGTTAEPAGSGSITIHNAAKGETYTIYKVFDATFSTTNSGAVAYTFSGSIPSELSQYFVEAGSGTGYVTYFKSGTTELDDAAITALTTWASGSTPLIPGVVSDGGILTFQNLPYGYYVITSSQGDKVISVDTTHPNADIYDKNITVPTADKTVEQVSYSIGDTIEYTAVFLAPNYIGSGEDAKQVVKYVISDTLPDFLSNVTVKSIKVGSELDSTGKEISGTALYSGTTQFDANKSITLEWATKSSGSWTSIYPNGSYIVVKYSGTLTDTVKYGDEGNKNTITLQPYESGTTPSGTPISGSYSDSELIKTYGAALKKIDGKTSGTLSGAEFMIAGLTATELSGTSGVYVVSSFDPSGTSGTILKVDSEGNLYILGLASGTNLSITETKAPDGYNKLDTPKELTVEALGFTFTETSGSWYKDADGNITRSSGSAVTSGTYKDYTELDKVAITISNLAGTLLPSTGGIGTTIFYIVGGLLAVGAGVVLVAKKRMGKVED